MLGVVGRLRTKIKEPYVKVRTRVKNLAGRSKIKIQVHTVNHLLMGRRAVGR